MLPGYHPVIQAIFGTLFTWALTAAGSALVFVFQSGQRKILDGSLGFAAGVMTAASYWSLLSPAIDMAAASGVYGSNGEWAFIPAAVGFALGATFVYFADVFMPDMGNTDPSLALALSSSSKFKEEDGNNGLDSSVDLSDVIGFENKNDSAVRQRGGMTSHQNILPTNESALTQDDSRKSVSWKRIMLLIIAITIHNIPEGLAVGVAFGAIGKSPTSTFENARNLAIGIGIQNFPEGLAVSLPLRGSGMSVWRSFWYGQLSGMVEPVAGFLGALLVVIAEPILPYALAFAAGAMIYVVVDDIIPEAQMCGNGTLASWGCIVGFIVMMSLDVGLG